ncbi:MAG: symmetrical bis(5'-nucleosyl)-tetraphosphatase [Wenzhouxiangellaceae bacterium]|nr:symmetrical bis(5'-nucleosyl)-tetraphosphatase [Wenzhouxiangellaceae bacterium]
MSARDIYIGDIQGCWDALARLLDKLKFDPAGDRLCLAGDLVNRGGKSLKVLRQLSRLGPPHFSVLGNHDLHLLAYWHMHPRVRKPNPEFERILDHKDGERVLDWLRQQPLLWLNERNRIALVHAGIDPRWTRAQARACAAEVEQALTGKRFGRYIDNMYGNAPGLWQPDQKRYTRLRSITNVLTRMRFARPDGRVDFSSKGDMRRPPRGYRPWFELLHPDWQGWSVVFGHWSLLGLYRHRDDRAICLDSGCVWGGQLTALVVADGHRRIVQIDCG